MSAMTADAVRDLLAKCRTELAKQWAIEKTATPGLWEDVSGTICALTEATGGRGVVAKTASYIDSAAVANVTEERANSALICQAHNFNPVRLRVAEKMLVSASGWADSDEALEEGDETCDWFWQLQFAAELLGVTP